MNLETSEGKSKSLREFKVPAANRAEFIRKQLLRVSTVSQFVDS